MLQVAYAGYSLVAGNVNQYIEDPVYYEPGFNLMTPLEIQGSIADRFYVIIRKRSDDTGINFNTILSTNMEITVTDASNGYSVPSAISANTIYDGWNDDPSTIVPLVLDVTSALDLRATITTRVRTIDIYIKDTTDDDFITFRVISGDENRYFNYIPVKMTELSARNTYTAVGRNMRVRISSDSDYYVLFTPYAYLSETTKDKADFSYPLNSVFYKRGETYNNEDYSFSISAYSNNFILETVSVLDVPSYGKAAVVLVDRIMYNKLIELGESAYVDIGVVGELSGFFDTFRINFSI